jgi:putative heme iron utilization protein
MTDPIRPADDDAIRLARGLMADARSMSLAVLGADGGPQVTRAAFGLDPDGAPLSLVSQLSDHTGALLRDPRCSLLIGEPGPKGDPLTHPRLTLQARAGMIAHDDPGYAPLADHWLRTHPKAKLYIGFTDFAFVRFAVSAGALNGGFGRAYRLGLADLGLPG